MTEFDVSTALLKKLLQRDNPFLDLEDLERQERDQKRIAELFGGTL